MNDDLESPHALPLSQHPIEETSQATLSDADIPLRLLSEQVPIGIFQADSSGAYLYVNPRWEEIAGIRAEQSVGDGWLASVHPDDRASVLSAWRKSCRSGTDFSLDYRIVRPSGEVRYISARARPIFLDQNLPASFLGSVTDFTERRRVEKKLARSEVLFRNVFQQQFQFMVILSPEGRVLELNDMFELDELAPVEGIIPREEVLGRFLWDTAWWLNLPDERAAWPARLRLAASHDGALISEDRFNNQAGELRIADSAITAVKDAKGEVDFFIVQGRDITERKIAEASLTDSERRLKEAQLVSGLGDWQFDVRTGKNTWSEALFGLFDRDPALGAPTLNELQAYYFPDDAVRHREVVRRAIESGQSFDLDLHLLLPGGREVFHHAIGHAVKDNHGTVVKLYGINQDITERKQAEAALHRTGRLLTTSQTMARVGGFELDLVNGTMLWSYEMYRIHDTEPESFTPSIATALEFYSAESRALFKDALQRAREGGAVWDMELALISATGRSKWVQVKTSPAGERPGQFIGAMQDITLRKQAEDSLRLSAMVYEHSSEAMMVCDPDNRIIAINPAFTLLTGYTAHEVLGKNPSMLSSGSHDLAFHQSMWLSINSTGQWRGEIWNKRKNGEMFAESLTINTIRRDDGSVHRYVALFSDITEKKKTEALIWQQANFDSLTGLPNRRMFRDRLQRDIKKSKREALLLAILFIDLDRFKEVNDTLGHNMGDILLIEAARRIRSCVRETDTVARWGGDEFTVTLSELNTPDRIESIAQNIISVLAAPFQLDDEQAFVSASIGITLYPDDATEIDDLLKHADQALYVAKDSGRNRFSYFTPALQVAAQTRMRLTNDLRAAIKEEQFRIYFQPIVHLGTGHIHKAEALIRWQHPQRGLIGPGDFIPLAEASGLIFDIGDWVFKEAARWVQRWRGLHDSAFQVSVNQSPLEFQRRADWVTYLQKIGLPGDSIVVEITEGLLLDASATVRDKLLEFRDAGIQVALDDFGTGFSSLSYLKKFDIDYLKIDRSFTSNLSPGSVDMALSEAIILMAHKLGLKVIAEGVETSEECRLLTAAGCDYAQGYLFARPIPAEEFDVLLLSRNVIA
ncbi:MAG: EAL domain-containing protein [Pseudomonadota bacterium]